MYYAFGFRDAGKVSSIRMKCEGKIVGAPRPSHVEDNVCKSCPDGFVCDGKKKTKCASKEYIDGNKCKKCPVGYTCKNGKLNECGRLFGISSVMAWNTKQKNHDVVGLCAQYSGSQGTVMKPVFVVSL